MVQIMAHVANVMEYKKGIFGRLAKYSKQLPKNYRVTATEIKEYSKAYHFKATVKQSAKIAEKWVVYWLNNFDPKDETTKDELRRFLARCAYLDMRG